MLCLNGLLRGSNTARVALCLVVLFAGGRAFAAGGDVTLTDNGSSVDLTNDFLSMTITKSNGRVTSLTVDGTAVINGSGARCYWQQAGHDSTNSTTVTDALNCTYRLVSQTADMVDVAFTCPAIPAFPFESDYHYVLRRDDHGFYAYCIVNYDTASGTCVYEQHDMVLRVNPSIYNYAVTDENSALMPTPAQIDAVDGAGHPNNLADSTYRMPDNSVYSKYQFHNFIGTDICHGVTGNGKGAWIIMPSQEDVNGGPTHQELTVHQTNTTPVVLRFWQGAHLGAGTTTHSAATGNWSKFCGPWFMYFNSGADAAAMFADAKAKAATEIAASPYTWLSNANYPLSRTTVHGRLVISDGSSPLNAWVILAETKGGIIPDWQTQGRSYHFWSRADAAGNFSIPKVRAGTYSLYAIVSGVMDEYRQDNVVVSGADLNLGDVSWTLTTQGEVLWQIGVPDRSAGEFRHGADYRTWANWEYAATEFPTGVDYTVGASNYATDWNYLHTNISNARPDWKIHFNLNEPAPVSARLRVAKAAGNDSRLRVQLNGTTIYNTTSWTYDSAVTRLGVSGLYEIRDISVPTNLLVNGANTITLRQDQTGTTDGVMYDAVRLEYVSSVPVELSGFSAE